MNMTSELANEILDLERKWNFFALIGAPANKVSCIKERQEEIKYDLNYLTWFECLAKAMGYMDCIHEIMKKEKYGICSGGSNESINGTNGDTMRP